MTLRAASLLALVSLSMVAAGCVPSDPPLPSAKEPTKKAAPRDSLVEPADAPAADDRTRATPASDSAPRAATPSEPAASPSKPAASPSEPEAPPQEPPAKAKRPADEAAPADENAPADDSTAEPRLLPPANEPGDSAPKSDQGDSAPASDESTGPFDDDPFPNGEPPVDSDKPNE